MLVKTISYVTIFSLLLPMAGPFLPEARANSKGEKVAATQSSTDTGAFDSAKPCPTSLDLRFEERGDVTMFHAQLSHLRRHYGKPGFEQKLQELVKKHWPEAKRIEISPTYWERVLSIVDMQRVRHFAVTLLREEDSKGYKGLQDEDYYWFDHHMKHIMLTGSTAGDLRHPLDRMTENVIKKMARSKAPKGTSKEEWELVKAEGIARVSEMFTFLSRWRVINGKIIDAKGAAAARKMAIFALGAIGAGVLVGTMVVSGPLIGGAGAAAGGMSSNPVVAGLLIKVAETAAGSLLGIVGAPAAMMVQDSYLMLSEADKQSKNNFTDLNCELMKRIEIWKSHAAEEYLTAAVTGGALGLAGGALTMTRAGAQMVLYATGFGVGVAQLFALGKMSIKTVEALAHYRMAEEALEAGNRDLALQLLHKARDLSQEAGEKALESIILGVLSYYLTQNFRGAMKNGAGAIRVLYANSADTLPMAEKGVEELFFPPSDKK